MVHCADWCTVATKHQVVPWRRSGRPPPATSLPEFFSRWRLKCSVTLSTSGPASYFCVVGWGPGGYSGIQQLEDGRHVALFSMWNRDAVLVEVRHGPGALDSTFGGEGTRIKAMAACAFREGEPCWGSPRVRGRRRPGTSPVPSACGARTTRGWPWCAERDGMVTVGPGVKEPCDEKRVGSDIISTGPK